MRKLLARNKWYRWFRRSSVECYSVEEVTAIVGVILLYVLAIVACAGYGG